MNEDFTIRQLLLRMQFLGIHKPKYNRANKDHILRAIMLYENIHTKALEIEDGYQ